MIKIHLNKTLALIGALALAASISACNKNVAVIGGADGPTNVIVSGAEKNKSVSDALGEAVLSFNEGGYLSGECRGEGHIIIDTEKSGDDTVVYAVVSYGEYGFEDGNFIKVSGLGAAPVKVTFDKNMIMTDFEEPEDGAYYEPSVREIFKKRYSQLESFSKKYDDFGYSQLLGQEKNYAKTYLKSIGREDAKIGEYGDFEHPLLTEEGVSEEVSNSLLENKELADYPMWIGSREKVEDGTRYVYELRFKKGDENIIYVKHEYGTEEPVETLTFGAKDGKRIIE